MEALVRILRSTNNLILVESTHIWPKYTYKWPFIIRWSVGKGSVWFRFNHRWMLSSSKLFPYIVWNVRSSSIALLITTKVHRKFKRSKKKSFYGTWLGDGMTRAHSITSISFNSVTMETPSHSPGQIKCSDKEYFIKFFIGVYLSLVGELAGPAAFSTLNHPHRRWLQFRNINYCSEKMYYEIYSFSHVLVSMLLSYVVQLIRAISLLNAFGNSYLWKKIKLLAYCFRSVWCSVLISSRLFCSIVFVLFAFGSLRDYVVDERSHFSTGIWKFIVIVIINCIILYHELRSVSNDLSLWSLFAFSFFLSGYLSRIYHSHKTLSHCYPWNSHSLTTIFVSHAKQLYNCYPSNGKCNAA